MQVQSRAFGDLSRIVFLTPWGRKVYGWMPQHPWLDVDNEFISLCNQINLLSKFYHDWMTKISVSSLGLINLFHSNESCTILIKFVIVMLRSLELWLSLYLSFIFIFACWETIALWRYIISAGYAEIYTRLINQSKLLLQVTQEMIFLTFCCTDLLYLLKSVMYFRFVIIYRLRMQ